LSFFPFLYSSSLLRFLSFKDSSIVEVETESAAATESGAFEARARLQSSGGRGSGPRLMI
jgi:hypothetical protein